MSQRSSIDYTNSVQEGEPPSDILQQLSESFQNFLFGNVATPKSPKQSNNGNNNNTEGEERISSRPTSPSIVPISPPSLLLSSISSSSISSTTISSSSSSSTISSMMPPSMGGEAPVSPILSKSNSNNNIASSPRNSITFPRKDLPQDEESDRAREKTLYEIDCMKLTLEEQLRQVEQKIAQNTNNSTDDPISQIKMWFEMRQLKSNLEKELKEVDLNIKRLTSGEPYEESPWDDFVSSFLGLPGIPSTPSTTSANNSNNNSNNNSVNVSDSELSDNESSTGSRRSSSKSYGPLLAPITFTPRTGIKAVALIDCVVYYEVIAYAIEKATREIFITSWFFSPELYLIRDPIPNPAYRLDYLLMQKAREGIQVYIILWDETKIAMFKGSKRAQEMLETHPNIHVIRHPPFTPLYWSHHQKLVVIDQETAFVGGVDLCFGRYDTITHPVSDHHFHVEINTPPSHVHCVWPGKDYYNPTVAPMGDITRPFEDSIDRKFVPRMPWHDTMIQVNGDAARDVALNFISRWNHHRQWNENQPVITWRNSLPEALKSPILTGATTPGTCTCQVLRSIDEWSGAPTKEETINQAYMEAIEDSDHYIYIENQNFVSSTAGGGVKNLVAVQIIKRIKRAIRKKETFHVYVMLPIAPDGQITDQTVRSLMHWNYQTISRGGTSILEQLRKDCPDIDPFDYISFYSLRTHGTLGPDSGVVTEQVYVHSKLMIVDDKTVIIGSNNVNDRSLLGDRDSELAIIVRDDTEKVNITMDGAPYVANKFAHDLRVNLFKEYLGVKHSISEDKAHLSSIDLTDPTAMTFYRNTWMAIATGNTKIYEHVFPHIPRDSIQTSEEYLSKGVQSKDVNMLEGVQGMLVLHPLDFLCRENLGPTILDSAIGWEELFQ